MGIQINGNTDIISATDGSLTIQGASGNLTGNLTGTATTAQGLTGTPNIIVGTIGATSLNASGVVTATSFSGALTGNVTGNATGLSGTPNITVGNIIASNATISGNVSVAGTVTYEDVTNIDSVGLVTARTGVRINAGGLVVVGVTTVAAGSVSSPSISPTGDSDTGIFFPSADTIAFGEGGAEALRIDSSGRVGIGTNSPSEILDCKGNIVLGAQNAAGASLQPTSSSGTDIAGSALILRSGRSTGSGSSGEIQLLASPGSTVSGTTVRNNGDSGLYIKQSPSGWNDHSSLGLLTVVFGSSIAQGNRSGLTGDCTVLTIDGLDTQSQSALEIVGSSNAGGGDQGFIRFYGSANKNPYATIVAVTPGANYTSGNLEIRTYNAGVQGTVATFTNTGNLGIGINNPGAKLEVAGRTIITQTSNGQNGLLVEMPTGVENTASGIRVKGYSPSIELMDKDSVQNWYIAIDDNVTNNFQIARGYGPGQGIAGVIEITPSDNVGIGVNNPSEKLEVSSATASGANISLVKQNSGTANQAGQQLHFYNYGPSATARAVDTECGLIRFFASQPTSGAAQEMVRITAAADVQQTGVFTQGRLTFSTRDATTNNLTERVRIDSSGRVTTPYQPGFFASSNSAAANQPGSGDVDMLGTLFNTTSQTGGFNTGNYYNTGTGIFTAPVAGKYYTFFNMRWETIQFVQNSYIRIFISKNNINAYAIHQINGSNEAWNSHMAMSCSGIIDLAAGDTLRPKGGLQGGTAVGFWNESSWGAWLLG